MQRSPSPPVGRAQPSPENRAPWDLAPLQSKEGRAADDALARQQALQPKDVRVLMARAVLRQRSGDAAGSERLYRLCLEAHPNFGPAFANLGALLLQGKREDEALALLLEGASRDPQHAPTFANLAAALVHHNRLDEALFAADAAVELDPKDADLRRNLAAVQFKLGHLRAAERTLREALAEFPDQAPDLLARLADLYVADKDPQHAAQMLGRINHMQPQDPLPWLRRAAILGQNEDLDGCIAVLLEALEHHPANEDVRGFFMAAMAMRMRRDLEEGMDRINANTADVDAYLQVARVHHIMRDPTSARDVLLDGVANNPGNHKLWHLLGVMQGELHQERDALASYRRAISLNAGAGPSLNNCAYLLTSAQDPSLRNAQEALVLATRAVELDPTNTAFLDTLAEANIQLGQMQRAQELITRARTLAPDDPYLLAQSQRLDLMERTGSLVPPPQPSGPRSRR